MSCVGTYMTNAMKRGFAVCGNCAAEPDWTEPCRSCKYNQETIRQLQQEIIAARNMLAFTADEQKAWLDRVKGIAKKVEQLS